MPVDMKQVIAAGFAKLLREKSIDKITVKDIVEKCGISRQTFYYHFRDRLDVMEYCIGGHLENALRKSLAARTPQHALEEFVQAACEHGDVLSRLIKSRKRPQIEDIFMSAMSRCIRRSLLKLKPDMRLSSNDLDAAVQFYAGGMTAVMIENCDNPNLDKKRLSALLYRLLTGNLIER